MAIADRTLVPETSEFDLTYTATTDISAYQYYFVKLVSGLVVACGANEKPLGILQNKPVGTATASALATVRVGGISKLKISETIVPGNFLTSTSAALGEVCDAANEEYGAVALTDGQANDLIAVLIQRGEVTASDA